MRTTLGMGATCTRYGQWAKCQIERLSESVRFGKIRGRAAAGPPGQQRALWAVWYH